MDSDNGTLYLVQVWNTTEQDWITIRTKHSRDEAIEIADSHAANNGYMYRVLRTELYYESKSNEEETAHPNK